MEVAQTIRLKRMSKPMEVFDEVVDSVDVPMPQVVEEVVEVAQISPERDQEAHRIRSATRARSRNTSRRRVDIPVPPVMQEIVTAVFGGESCVFHTTPIHCTASAHSVVFVGTQNTHFSQVMSPSTIQQFAEIY